MHPKFKFPWRNFQSQDHEITHENEVIYSITILRWNSLKWYIIEPQHEKKQQNDLCGQGRLRSAWVCAQSDQSSLSAYRNLGSLATHWMHSEDSDQTVQADLSLHWVHRLFCWLSHAQAQFSSKLLSHLNAHVVNRLLRRSPSKKNQ